MKFIPYTALSFFLAISACVADEAGAVPVRAVVPVTISPVSSGQTLTSRVLPDHANGSMKWAASMGWTAMNSNLGHMIEAAVAHHQSTGKRTFLDVAIKAADLLCKTWGPGPGQLKISPGHQEIELALIKLGRATGQSKYIELSQFLLECRGHYRREEGRKYEADAIHAAETKLWYDKPTTFAQSNSEFSIGNGVGLVNVIWNNEQVTA